MVAQLDHSCTRWHYRLHATFVTASNKSWGASAQGTWILGAVACHICHVIECHDVTYVMSLSVKMSHMSCMMLTILIRASATHSSIIKMWGEWLHEEDAWMVQLSNGSTYLRSEVRCQELPKFSFGQCSSCITVTRHQFKVGQPWITDQPGSNSWKIKFDHDGTISIHWLVYVGNQNQQERHAPVMLHAVFCCALAVLSCCWVEL